MDVSTQVGISRRLSYVLRHNPSQFDVELDTQGYADLGTVAEKLGLRAADIRAVVEAASKRRFEISGDRIRALYGHSVGLKLEFPPVVPPETLYHGTSWRLVRVVLEAGLKPMGRLFVHLSETEEEARQIGRRREPSPAVLRVAARRAHDAGLRFFKPGDVYLTEEVPAEYLFLPEE